jgi:hypothetical protein
MAFPLILNPELFLTLRERQVLWLIGDEKSNKDIARMLGIGTRAVEGYRSSIWQKLKAHWSEERTRNLALLITTAVKYQMRCSYPGSNLRIKNKSFALSAFGSHIPIFMIVAFTPC